MTPYDNLCAAISIIQGQVLARDICTDGMATFGVDFMPSQALEHAARLLADLLPLLEPKPAKNEANT